MITRLRLENFKSWEDTGDLRLGRLTGLFGTNSSGKTSLLQALLMMRQTVESRDRSRVVHTGDDRSLVDLGTFHDLLYNHDAERPLRLSFSWTLPERLSIANPETPEGVLYRISALSFTTEIRERQERPVVESFAYQFDGHCFGMRRREENGHEKDAYDLNTGDFPAKRVQGRPWPLPSPVKCYGFPDEATGYYQNTGFLPDLVLALEGLFSRLSYLGPLREYPHRTYIWGGDRPLDVGQRGEQAVAALLAARAADLKSGRGKRTGRRYKPIEARMAEWLRKAGLIHSFELRPVAEGRKDFEVKVKTARDSAEVLITDVGFGVSQLLPVLVLCYYVPEGSTILLEQPEIHLHPSVQAALADLFIDVVINRNVQIIVESHSEHLLRRLQRRIAEEAIAPDDTALYFCRREGGASVADKLEVDLYGNIVNWPAGFFGDEMGDLFAKTEAEMRRRAGIPR